MRIGVYDIEADGLLNTVTKVFCIAIKEGDLPTVLYEPDELLKGIEHLKQLDVVIGHNIINYDNQVLKKLYGVNFADKSLDTLILSKLRYPFFHLHSLASWGERLKFNKGDYNNFDYYEPEMGEYCKRDVELNYKVYKHLKQHVDTSAEYVKLEHDVQGIQNRIEEYGVGFNYDGAVRLIQEIDGKMWDTQEGVSELLGYVFDIKSHKLNKSGELSHHAKNLLTKLKETYPEFEHDVVIEEGVSVIKVPTKVTLDKKNLLIDRLIQLGWSPVWTTEKGSPQISRKGVLDPNLEGNSSLSTVGEYFILKHRLGLLKGLLKAVREDGRIASEADILGTVTGRYAHKVIANFPAGETPYGKDIRSLFFAGKGRTQLGCDLAGIEARILAHYMDDPDYTHEVLNGDIHTKNQISAGLPTRSAAKTFIYAYLYGAGDGKIGSIIGGGAAEGKLIKATFLASLPRLKALIDKVQADAETGVITSLGNRPVRITKSPGYNGKMSFDTRKALNSLLQSAGATYFKHWMVEVQKGIDRLSIDANIMIAYHDELQISVSDRDIDRLKEVLYYSLTATDRHYELKCRNDIDVKIGDNWHDTH